MQTSMQYVKWDRTDLADLALSCCWQLQGHQPQEQAQGHSGPAGHLAGPAGLPVQQQPAHLAVH